LLLLSSGFLALVSERYRGLLLGVAGLALTLLLLTKSRTAFAGVLVVLFTSWLLAKSLPRRLALLANIVLPVVLILLFLGYDLLAGLGRALLLGRETETAATLTERTPVWDQCWAYAMQHLWTGYGYGAFWTTRRAAEITASQGWSLAEAHNAYLDMILNAGLVATLALVLILLLGVMRAVGVYRRSHAPEYLFLVALLTFGALNGLLESVIIAPSFLTFLMIIALIRLGFLEPDAEPVRSGNHD
jgi:O-antigen ligase